MKYILIFLLFSIIACSPLYPNISERLRERRLKRREKILECINKEGSESLKKLFNENKNSTLLKIFRENKDNISKEDKLTFFKCRKEALKIFRFNRKYMIFKNGNRKFK